MTPKNKDPNPFELANDKISNKSLNNSYCSPTSSKVRTNKGRQSLELQDSGMISLQYDGDGETEKCRLCRRDLRSDEIGFFCVEESDKHERFRLCIACFFKKSYD